MNLSTTSFVDQKNGCGQDVMSLRMIETHMVVPGASTCCTGCTSSSCCCGALTDNVAGGVDACGIVEN